MSMERPDHAASSDLPTADRRALLAGLGGLAAGALLAGARTAQAGPLNPPPGPVNSTGVTLDEIAARTALPSGIAEPRRPYLGGTIAQPGSYYLTGDVLSPIVISAPDVSLDLCGFTVQVAGVAAIELLGSADRVLIRNGRIEGRSAAFGVLSNAAPSVTVEDLIIIGTVLATPSAGISISGGSAVCRRITVSNYRFGITLFSGVIDDCHATNCTGGFQITPAGGIVRRSSVRGSGEFSGINVGINSTVIECHVSSLGPAPCIRASAGSLVDQCVVSGGRTGILTSDNCAVLRCVVRGAQGVGIDVAGSCRVADCLVTGTTAVAGGDPGVGIRGTQRLRLERSAITSNAARGVLCTSSGAGIADCSSVANGSFGIECVGPATIDRCNVANNVGGIRCDALTRVSQCRLDANGQFGVLATSTSVGGTFVTDCEFTSHTIGADIRSTSGSGVFRSRFALNSFNIVSPAANFQLTVFGTTDANAATNPNINIAL